MATDPRTLRQSRLDAHPASLAMHWSSSKSHSPWSRHASEAAQSASNVVAHAPPRAVQRPS